MRTCFHHPHSCALEAGRVVGVGVFRGKGSRLRAVAGKLCDHLPSWCNASPSLRTGWVCRVRKSFCRIAIVTGCVYIKLHSWSTLCQFPFQNSQSHAGVSLSRAPRSLHISTSVPMWLLFRPMRSQRHLPPPPASCRSTGAGPALPRTDSQVLPFTDRKCWAGAWHPQHLGLLSLQASRGASA